MAWGGSLESRRRRGSFAGGLAFSFAIAAKFSSMASADVTLFFQRAMFQFGSVMVNSIGIP